MSEKAGAEANNLAAFPRHGQSRLVSSARLGAGALATGLCPVARAALGVGPGLRYAGYTAWRGVTSEPVLAKRARCTSQATPRQAPMEAGAPRRHVSAPYDASHSLVRLNRLEKRGSTVRTAKQLSDTLPNSMAEALQERVVSGANASESEVVRDGLRADRVADPSPIRPTEHRCESQ
ncbi:hypothetical protein GCM10020360_03620 [Nonlabens tegetincola]